MKKPVLVSLVKRVGLTVVYTIRFLSHLPASISSALSAVRSSL